MDRIDIDKILTILDYLLTKKKHIVVGSLFSISLFFERPCRNHMDIKSGG